MGNSLIVCLCLFAACHEPVPLGMQDGTIANSQISSSSYPNSAKNARLGGSSSWNPIYNLPSEWLRVDLLSIVTMTAVKTQGSAYGPEYWTKLHIATGVSVDSMSYFKDDNQNKKVSVSHRIVQVKRCRHTIKY